MARSPLVLAAAALLLTACGTAAGTPTAGTSSSSSTSSAPSTSSGVANDQAFTDIQVAVSTGSVPPPYNHTWVLSFDPADPNSAELVWRTNHAEQDQEWSTDIALVEDALPDFLALAEDTVDRSFDEGSLAGGGGYGLRMIAADGSEHEVYLGSSEESAAAGSAVADAARALIPDADFERLEARYEQWSAEND